MARVRDTVACAMGEVTETANEVENTAEWGARICDKVWREGITVKILGIPIGVELGAPDETTIGPKIIRRLRQFVESLPGKGLMVDEEPKP